MKEDEKEIMAAHNKFQELLSICQKYNLDATELYEAHHQEISFIIDKQLEKGVTATIEAEERIQAALSSSSEKQKNEIQKRYSDLLALAQQHGIDTDAIRQQIQEKMDRELKNIQDPGGMQLFNITEEEWEEFEEKMNMVLDLAGQLNNIWGQFNEFQNNRDKKELQDYEKNTNKKKELLNKQLESGRISQERYNARIAQLDADLDKKKTEIANRQAKRDKAQGIFSATINTASSIMQALANVAPPYSYVLAAISAAMGAVQIATIASTPLPEYAQGGMTDGARVYIAGEAGREWIAPNNMLNDPITGPIIQQRTRSLRNPLPGTIASRFTGLLHDDLDTDVRNRRPHRTRTKHDEFLPNVNGRYTPPRNGTRSPGRDQDNEHVLIGPKKQTSIHQ